MKKITLVLAALFLSVCFVTAGNIVLPPVSSSIIFSNPIVNNSMYLGVENNPNQEGYTIPTTVQGVACQEIPAGKFMYSYSNRSAVPTSATNIIISITYYDSSMNSIWVNYTRNGNSGGWGTGDFPKSNTKKWITRIITITDAGLDGSMGYSGDIRIGGSENNYISNISISIGTLNPSAESVPAQVGDPSSEFTGKSFAGYQLWHQAGPTPQDWVHWSYGMLPAAGRGNHNTETFPLVSDFTANSNVALYATNFANLGDGTPTKLYNSTDSAVIDVQMTMLKNAGYDGVAIQRNAPIGRAIKAQPYDYCVSVKNACEANSRQFYIMYCMPDTNNNSPHYEDAVAGIERDWVYQIEQVYALTSSKAYATVNGKPVVELWGLGYSTIEINSTQAIELANFFKARGCYVIAGTPRDWRLMNEGSRTDYASAYKAYNMISPWTVGAYSDSAGADNYKTNYEVADKAYCDANGMGYYPTVFVGSAWSETENGYPNDTKRMGGKFLWEQALNAKSIGVHSMYFAMLDEFEESTDIINAARDYFDIPTDQYFGTLAMDGIWVSSDYYLRLGGAAARMVGNGTNVPAIVTPYSLGPIYYRNSFESRVANCIINGNPQNIVSPIDACFYHDGVISNTNMTSPSVAIVQPSAGFTKSGIYSTQITGTANGASKYYYQISETKIAVKSNIALSFWKYSANTLGQYTSVDLLFKSGKSLHSLAEYRDAKGNQLTPTVARGNVGTWQQFTCLIGSGELLGDTITGICIAYDNPSSSGAINAYFDDIIIRDSVGAISTTGPYGGTAWPIPGIIQAENYDLGGEGVAYHDNDAINQGGAYRTTEGVDVENCSDAGGGYDIGFTNAGEWTNYTVNVATTGTYTLQVRLASPNSSTDSLHVEIDGVNISGEIIAPNTGGWQTWQTVSITTSVLSAGQHILRIYNATGGFNINYVTFVLLESPYGGNSWPIPGTIQAENYDLGGEGVAYHDNDATNQGGAYRTTEGVDVENCSDAGSGYDVGSTNASEWMNYTVNVATTGIYTLQVRLASPNSSIDSLHVEIDGVNISGEIIAPNTGGWQTWQTVSVTTAILSAGQHIMRIYEGTGGFNINYVTFVLLESPYGGNSWPIPGTIQAENYDLGGEGIAYHDNDATNQGGAYRTTEGVDVENCSDVGGGYDIGFTNAGEWTNYIVNVATTGDYTLQVRLASPNSSIDSLHAEIDGVNISGEIIAPNTGGWQTWQTVNVTTSMLSAGQHILRIYNATGGFNINYVTFTVLDWITCAGATTTLVATISQLGNTYQWQLSTDNGATYNNISNNSIYSGVTDDTLVLNNVSSSFNGYLYRCEITNGTTTNSPPNVLEFDDMWIGAVSNAWETGANWSCGNVPDNNTDVIINSGTPIISSTVSIRSLKLNSSGSHLTINSGYHLNVLH